MRIVLLDTNPSYSHLIVYRGIKEAFEQIKGEDPTFSFIEKNICHQDDGEIQRYQPDFVFVSAPLAAGFRIWQKNRKTKCIIYDTESLYEPSLTRDSIHFASFCATVDKRGTQYFSDYINLNKIKCRMYHMPLGFSPSVFKFETVDDTYKSDVCLIGVMFDRRRKVLEDLVPLKDKIQLRVITAKDWYRRIIHPDAIQFLHKDIVSVEESNKYYCGAKIVLCVNRDYQPSNDTKIQSTTPGRVFQEAACRRMVMIDRSRPEIFDYFEDGKEIVTFDENNPEDLREKILYYLSHDEERESIAHNGYIRTMSENTWKIRITKLLKFIENNPL